MTSVPKQLVLLAAYEELTEKERFCLQEGNMEGCLRAQEKKAKLLVELQQPILEPLVGQNLKDYQKRVESLQKQEQENAKTLSGLIKENRDTYKGLAKQSGSAAKFRKAYANPSEKKATPNNLEGQA